MNSRQVMSLITFALFSAGALAQASDLSKFTYQTHVAKVANQTCDQAAQHFGQTFENLTGLNVSATFCVDQAEQSETISIDYMAADAVNSYSATFGKMDPTFGVSPTDNNGLYANLSDCQADLSAQKMAFKTNAGLTPINAVCYADPLREAYVLRIDAIGTAKKMLYGFTAFGTAVPAATVNMVKSFLTSEDAVIAKVVDSTFYYYATGPLHALNTTEAVLTSADQCTSQIEAAQKIYTRGGATHALAVCIENLASYDLQVVSLDAGFMSQNAYANGTNYSSFASCMNDRDRVIGAAKANGATVFGALCQPGINEGTFNMSVYSN